jgi:uncharacterized membrane protein
MGKNERNEKRKLTAALINGIGVAIFGVTLATVLSKGVERAGLLALLLSAALAVSMLHMLARIALRGMEE